MVARISILVVLATVAGWAAAGCGKDSDGARIDRLRREGNVAALAAEAGGPEEKVAQWAVGAMAELGPKSAAAVETSLRDPRPAVREAAAIAYARVANEKQLAALAAVARGDESADVRAAAVTGLGQARALDQMETLLAALEDPNRTVRERASLAAARIMGRRYETYVDGTPEQRREAVAALRQVWPMIEQGTRDYYRIEGGRTKG